ncbi:MAG: SH3 domain-containing protein [Bacteroidota bacterium]
MRHIIVPLILILFFYNGNCQIVVCQWEIAQTYQVIAKSGLKLRSGPSQESSVLKVIPYKSELKACYENTKQIVIDNIRGEWVKAYWEEMEGYVFNGYILKQAPSKALDINLFNTNNDLVNEWKSTMFSRERSNVGLFRKGHENKFELRKIRLEEDPNSDYLIPNKNEGIPIWIFNTYELDLERVINGRLLNKMIFIGEKVKINEGIMYGFGQAQKSDSLGISSLAIDPYELRFEYHHNNQIYDELLVKMNCHSGLFFDDSYEKSIIVNFIGDLDDDGMDDILVTIQSSFKGWDYYLFSTSIADDDKPFKGVKVGYGTE